MITVDVYEIDEDVPVGKAFCFDQMFGLGFLKATERAKYRCGDCVMNQPELFPPLVCESVLCARRQREDGKDVCFVKVDYQGKEKVKR